MKAITHKWICFVLLLLSVKGHAFTLSGKITDAQNNPLPFAIIYIKGTTSGATANVNGIYSIELKAGTYEVLYQLIGYKVKKESISLSADKVHNVVLEEEAFMLNEVKVAPGKEDPAYEMIRQAQKKRTYYLTQVEAYACDVYIKGLQRITKYPKKILGQEINLNDKIDTATGIAYLSESVSKYWYERPDKVHEVLISSKVSGRNSAFSYNQASDMMFNFYQNLIQTSIAQRGVISPIANGCFLSYRYKFLGSFFEKGVLVNKIQVTPKREADPCFTGIIYLCDSTWRFYSVDLFVTKKNQIRFVDTLKISQVFLPVNDSVWMPFTNKFSFVFSVFGFEGNGYYTGINSNYSLNPVLAKKFFKGEEWHVNDDSNKKDSAYWDSIRPVPLTREEITDYRKKDSLHKIWDSKAFKDSVDKRENRFKFSKIWLGFTWKNSWKEYYVSMSPPLLGFLFNTTQGWNLGTKFSLNHNDKETRKEYEISLYPSYGFSSRKFFLTGSGRYDFNPKKFSAIELSGGRAMQQFNGSEPISHLVNALYSLFDKRNYMKVYQKDFVRLWWRHELRNGIMLSATAEYADRTALVNHSAETWVKRSYAYEGNDPQNTANENPAFISNSKFELTANVRLRIGQRYYTRPNQKINVGSKFPEININWKKAVAGVAGSSADYDMGNISLSDRINFKRLGRGYYLIKAGKFFSSKQLPFIDYKHFNGNQTIFSDFDAQKFQLLDYYTYSSNTQYAEAFYIHNFGGFIVNKLPLLRKTKMEEIAGVHYAWSPLLQHYSEYSFGFRYLFVRGDFVYGINKGISRYGFRFGLLF